MRRYVLNLIVPLIAVGFAFAGIVSAQENANQYGEPQGECSPTLTRDNLGYNAAISVGPTGDVFVLEDGAACVIRIDAAGVGHLAVGHGRRSDACPACGVNLVNPSEMEVGQDGTVYVLDHLNDRTRDRILAIAPDGTATTIAQDPRGYYGTFVRDREGRLYVVNFDQVLRLDPSGPVLVAGGGGADVGVGAPATSVRLDLTAIAVGPGGNLYIVESRRHRVLRVDPAGTISLFAGTGFDGESGDGGPATEANIVPNGIIADEAGNVFISIEYGHKVRRVDAAGVITTFAGRGAGTYGGPLGDGGPAAQAAIGYPTDLAVHDGNLYILDVSSPPRIRKVDKAGIITTLAVGQR